MQSPPKRRGPATQKFTRNPPSHREQMRREAWGREWGPKVGASIRAYIQRSEES